MRAQDQSDQPKSHAELTNYEETSRYEDVIHFFDELQKRNPLVRRETFGHSQEGRALPLIILSDPPVSQPREARDSAKPVVLVLANIHAGEVEGKEATQEIARRLVAGDLRLLLKKVIVLLAPIYNADGNERISLTNRVEQNGPIGGVGVRENAQRFDLNRDFIKVEAPETAGLLRLLNEWDPHLMVDLHTTDGSYHGYHLTYSIPLNPSIDEALSAYHREKLMPALGKAMLQKHQFRTYYYGNFSTTNSLARQSIFMGEAKTDPNKPRIWRAFSPQPRVGVNYVGFRNRLCILSEAYSYLDFRRRVEVTTAFVEEILKYGSAHAGEIIRLTSEADRDATTRVMSGETPRIGVEYKPKALPQPVPILVGEIRKVKNSRSGLEMTAMVENKITTVKMPDYGMFTATRTIPIARAYVFRPQDGLRVVVDKLQAHGISVEEVTLPLTTEVETFVIKEVNRAERRFQGHSEVKIRGDYAKQEMTFEPGTILVRTSQPLGVLAAYLLEPESEDGLATWNFLDPFLEPQKTYPIYKLIREPAIATQTLER
jgi:hypothetical protein